MPNIKSAFSKALRSPEAWSTAATGIRLAGGLLILPWALKIIPPNEIGLWYIWGSLGAIAGLADFGFASTVTRAAAFYFAGGQTFRPTGMKEGDAKSGIANLLKLELLAESARRLYIILAVLLAILLAVLGYALVFKQVDPTVLTLKVRTAWWVFVGTCAFSLYGRWQSAFMAGVGRVIETAQLTVLSQIIYLIVVAIALKCGGGLVALAAGQALPTIILNILLYRWLKKYRSEEVADQSIANEVGLKVLWPTAWRYGLVMIGSYLINNTTMLVSAHYLTLAQAGSFGLANQTLNLIMGTCFAAIQARVPQMVALRAQGRVEALHRLVGRTLLVCCVLFTCGAVGLITVAPTLLESIGSKTALPETRLLMFFVAYRFLELHQSFFACVVMTENEVPFVIPALVSGVAIVGLATVLAPHYGIFGIMLATALVQAAYNNWWTVWRGLRGLGCGYFELFRFTSWPLAKGTS